MILQIMVTLFWWGLILLAALTVIEWLGLIPLWIGLAGMVIIYTWVQYNRRELPEGLLDILD